LGVLWAGESIKDFLDQSVAVREQLGIEIVARRVVNATDLPDHLREMEGKIDALWLPPDAALVTPTNFETIRGFASAKQIPFYVPSDGLVEQGAMASFSSSYKDIGILAAKLARQALENHEVKGVVFPEDLQLAVNLPAAKRCNLKITPEILRPTDRTYP
jgi:putative ABC transport system substrate-binding protein